MNDPLERLADAWRDHLEETCHISAEDRERLDRLGYTGRRGRQHWHSKDIPE